MTTKVLRNLANTLRFRLPFSQNATLSNPYKLYAESLFRNAHLKDCLNQCTVLSARKKYKLFWYHIVLDKRTRIHFWNNIIARNRWDICVWKQFSRKTSWVSGPYCTFMGGGLLWVRELDYKVRLMSYQPCLIQQLK